MENSTLDSAKLELRDTQYLRTLGHPARTPEQNFRTELQDFQHDFLTRLFELALPRCERHSLALVLDLPSSDIS